MQAHHIHALEDGGDPFALSNLVTLCARCHREQPRFLESAPATRRPDSRETNSGSEMVNPNVRNDGAASSEPRNTRDVFPIRLSGREREQIARRRGGGS